MSPQELADFAKQLTADGAIDAAEVSEIRSQLFADGTVDRDEANFLFDVHAAVKNSQNHPSWQAFFVEALTSHLLEDPQSPGEIDAAEGDWLLGRIGDGKDAAVKALLANLKKNAKSVAGRLKERLA